MSDKPAWNSRLPENYGEGQRQFDMYSAAERAAEPLVYACATLSGVLAALLLHSWIAVVVAVPIYKILMRPYRKAREKASKELDADRAAWLRQFE